MIITIVGTNATEEKKWADSLKETLALAGILTPEVSIGLASSGSAAGDVFVVDGSIDDLETMLPSLRGSILLVLPEKSSLPYSYVAEWISQGKILDVLISPFRTHEVLSKIRQSEQAKVWKEVSSLNTSLAEVVARLEDDLKLAERLQKSKTPKRFPDVKGMKVASRYLAGMKSGGDHFDLAEAASGNQLSIVLSDSSSYGLSSAVLSVLVRVAVKLTADEVRSCESTVRTIQEELLLTLGEKDRLSMFYGTISRKDYRLRYVNMGSSAAFYAPPRGAFSRLSSQGPAFSRQNQIKISQEEVELHPEGRLVLVSDGFIESAGGDTGLQETLNRFRDREAADLLNELVFKVKEKLTEPDDMPAQDCTVALFDIDARILRKI